MKASLLEWLRKTVFVAIVVGAIFAACCMLARSLVPIRGWGSFFAVVGIASAMYLPVGLFGLIDAAQRRLLLESAGAPFKMICRLLTVR
jgi:uncharacterized membrane protein (DUF2068 family)